MSSQAMPDPGSSGQTGDVTELAAVDLGALTVVLRRAEARRRGAGLVQLTTGKSRPDAHRFYQRFGFAASHEGMKLRL
jgi:hypothetical protein